MRIRESKKLLKIVKNGVITTLDKETQMMYFDDSYYSFGLYVGKWKRLKSDTKKLKFIRELLMFLNKDEDTQELSRAFLIAEEVVKRFNLLSEYFLLKKGEENDKRRSIANN